jgi:hypothetical protein
LRLGRGEGVEDGGFSYVRQADDSAIERHFLFECPYVYCIGLR